MKHEADRDYATGAGAGGLPTIGDDGIDDNFLFSLMVGAGVGLVLASAVALFVYGTIYLLVR